MCAAGKADLARMFRIGARIVYTSAYLGKDKFGTVINVNMAAASVGRCSLPMIPPTAVWVPWDGEATAQWIETARVKLAK